MELVADRHSASSQIELPRTFAHRRPPKLISGFVGGGVGLAGCGALLAMVFTTLARLEIPLAPLVGFAILATATLLAMPLFLLANLIPLELDVRRRRDSRLDASDRGLRYHDARREVFTPWAEVESVVLEEATVLTPRRLTIRCRRGDFDLGESVEDFPRLFDLLEARAPDAVARGRSSVYSPDDLLRLPLTVGITVHHYRTRTTRALLVLALLPGVVFTNIAWRDRDLAFGVFGLLCLLATAPLFDLYLSTRVVVAREGLTFTRRRRTTFVPWPSITAWRDVDAHLFSHLAVTADGRAHRVWASVLDREGLVRALRQRAPTTSQPEPTRGAEAPPS